MDVVNYHLTDEASKSVQALIERNRKTLFNGVKHVILESKAIA